MRNLLMLGVLAMLIPAAVMGQFKQDDSSSYAPAAKRLTLAEAEQLAIRNNPQITIGNLRALVARQYERAARSAFYPTANVSVTGVGANSGSRIAAGALNNPVVYPRAAVGASVSQLVTDFGRTLNLLSSASYQAKAEEENSRATRAQILIAVDQAYYSALEAKALLSVAQQTADARQVLVDKVQALTDAKLKSELDLSFSKVDLARAKLLLLQARNTQQTSLAALSAILGYADLQAFELAEELPPTAPPPVDPEPLIQEALQQRPELLALQDEVSSAEKFGSAEHKLWMPTVSALGVVGDVPVRDPHIPSWYGAAGVNINIPVFNGFLYNARAKSADLQTEVQRQKLLEMRNGIARDVRDAWLESTQAYERLTVTQQLREQASLSLELAQSRYNLGLGSIVELSQAVLQKTEADIADTDAKYQYRVSELQVEYQTATKMR